MFALCKTCHRAIYQWSDVGLLVIPGAMAVIPPENFYWTHFRSPSDRHNAVPMTSIRDRVLMCTGCNQPQEMNGDGWHCPNTDCPHRVDND